MTPTDVQPLMRFYDRVRQALKAGARDIRMTTNEASELATVMAQIMTGQLSARPVSTKSVALDGGRLK